MEIYTNNRPDFASDYTSGAHPAILKVLVETNPLKSPGYGADSFSDSARNKIRAACACPDAEVHFLVGGTQTNATAIDAMLLPYQGVIAADSGHISVHEAGAIERNGHKILTLPHKLGKIAAADIEQLVSDYNNDENRDHMVMPGMVYISHPTEYGTLYTRSELEDISRVCHANNLPLYLDGARLAYALAGPENDVPLKDLARFCDVFYIGGTKCGALFGEAVVITQKGSIPHFLTIMKQHGAVLAKGRLLGLQFDTFFTDDLYLHIGAAAISAANRIKAAFLHAGYRLLFDSPTNQIFVVLENTQMEVLAEKVQFSFWEKYDDTHTVVRLATSWATTEDEVNRLIAIISS